MVKTLKYFNINPSNKELYTALYILTHGITPYQNHQQLKLDFLKSQNAQEKEQLKLEEDKLKKLNEAIGAQKKSLDLNKEQIKQSQEALKNQSLINQRTQVLNTYVKDLGGNLVKNLKDPLFIVGFLVKQIIDAFKIIYISDASRSMNSSGKIYLM